MSEKPKEGLDRRDLMMASIATVGASAMLARSTGPAKAQDTAAPSGDAASGTTQTTMYTGDVINGNPVFFQPAQNPDVGKSHRTTAAKGNSDFGTGAVPGSCGRWQNRHPQKYDQNQADIAQFRK